MKKIMFWFILLITFGQVCADQSKLTYEENLIYDKLVDESVCHLYESFLNIPDSKFVGKDGREIQGFGIVFESDLEDKVSDKFRQKFTKTKFKVYRKEGVDKLLEEQAIQSQDFYSKAGRLKIGQLTQWKGYLVGKINYRLDNHLFKKSVYVDITSDFFNLEDGNLIWSDKYTNSYKVKLPIKVYLIGLAVVLILTILFNILTRGKSTTLIMGLALVGVISYSIWFFVL